MVRQRLDPQLPLECLAEDLELVECPGALAQAGLGFDQGTMEWLVERVEGQRASRQARDLAPVTPGAVGLDDGRGRAQVGLPDPLPLGVQPELEVGRLGHGEAVQQRTAEELERLLLLLEGSGALDRTDVRPRVRPERQPEPIGADDMVAERLANDPEVIAEVLLGRLRKALRPEQRLEPLARHRPAGHGEIAEERDGLVGGQLH